MVPYVPSSDSGTAHREALCRRKQLHQLAIYYNHQLPSPPTLVAHGLDHTGKLKTVVACLNASKIRHTVVRTVDCLSQRHLIAKIYAACLRGCEGVKRNSSHVEKSDRIDGLNALYVGLQRLFEGLDEKFVLVIHGIDRQKGASHALLPAIARLGDLIPNLSLILTSSSSRAIPLHRSGIPFIHFPPYDRAEAITITAQNVPALPQNLPTTFATIPMSRLLSLYKTFVTTVYDTLTTHTSSLSLQALQQTCEKLWPRFIWPLLSNEVQQNKSHNKDVSSTNSEFARLLGRNRSLFQLEGEKALQYHLTSDDTVAWTFEQLITDHEKKSSSEPSIEKSSDNTQEYPLLKRFSTLLLVSAYLASHTAAKHDIILFSRLSSSSTNKRKYLSSALSKSRASGVRKTPTKKRLADFDGTSVDATPSKKRKAANETTEGLAGEKTPKSTRLLLEKTSNIPRSFTLERLVAILRAVHPDGLPRTKAAADNVYGEMAELERFRLVVRGGGGSGDAGSRTDDGILEEKWRINVGRDFVSQIGKHWDMSLEGWEID